MLNIGSSGSGKPYVKFNGKSGRWYRPGEDGEVKIQCATERTQFASQRAVADDE